VGRDSRGRRTGTLGIQYAKATGLHVIAVDVDDDKLALAREVGAAIAVNSAIDDPVKVVEREIGGAYGVLITAPSLPAFHQGIGMMRWRGTCVLVGLPPGEFPLSVFDVVLKRSTVRGSLAGTRADMREALSLAASHGIAPQIKIEPLEINNVFDRLRHGKIEGRVVLDFIQRPPELVGSRVAERASHFR
jgi:propanol-preferring alcohol dehydrogenase